MATSRDRETTKKNGYVKMTKMKTILLGILTICSLQATRNIEFRYERDLIDMFDHKLDYGFDERAIMLHTVNNWLNYINREVIAGRLQLSEEDNIYLVRIACMVCDINN